MGSDPDNQWPAGRNDASESSMEDDKLVLAAANGDESASARLVEKYRSTLYFNLLKMVKEKEQAEDLVQEVFVKVFDNLQSYNANYAFSTWVYRIATNHTIDYLRKKRLQTFSIDEPVKSAEGDMEVQIPDDNFEADRNILRKERKNIIRKAIQDLPEKYRRVIEMRHMEEKSYQTISEILDLPLGTVKAHIFRAREMLYKALIDRRDRF